MPLAVAIVEAALRIGARTTNERLVGGDVGHVAGPVRGRKVPHDDASQIRSHNLND
jgi:hypothetical protein